MIYNKEIFGGIKNAEFTEDKNFSCIGFKQ